MAHLIYHENTWPEFGVSHQWSSAQLHDTVITHRGTYVEMVARPKWGLACYMDNAIQSCEADERFYHESLVHPAMSMVNSPKRVMILGGGEGATAREVLKWQTVQQVDMYEWDRDVVALFRGKYKQWAKGAWTDERLTVYDDDIFQVIQGDPREQYDVIIIDLFEPSEDSRQQWMILLQNLHRWITIEGSVAIYTGIRNLFDLKQKTQITDYLKTDDSCVISVLTLHRDLIPYRVYIPSFSGESMFLLMKYTSQSSVLCDQTMSVLGLHLTDAIWKSYQTFNW